MTVYWVSSDTDNDISYGREHQGSDFNQIAKQMYMYVISRSNHMLLIHKIKGNISIDKINIFVINSFI